MADRVRIFEVAMRDGLQNEPSILSTDVKISLLHHLVSAGFQDIEVTSFVRARAIPQLADAAELIAALPDVPGTRFWALVPNQVGMDRALEAGMQHIATFLSASETHNRKNVNRTVRESLDGLRKVIDQAVHEKVGVRSYISTVFGCPYEGDVPVDNTVRLAHALFDAGATEVILGDTTGMADPAQVKRILGRLVAEGLPIDRIGLHFHDTRGTALTNVYAAWQAGARMFDGAIAGVGGCPYAPGASGNVATEDLLYMFERMGVETGVDLGRASEAGDFLESVLGRGLPGRYHQYQRAAASSKAATA